MPCSQKNYLWPCAAEERRNKRTAALGSQALTRHTPQDDQQFDIDGTGTPTVAPSINLCRHLDAAESDCAPAWSKSKWRSWLGHSWPPRARQTASEGLGPAF